MLDQSRYIGARFVLERVHSQAAHVDFERDRPRLEAKPLGASALSPHSIVPQK